MLDALLITARTLQYGSLLLAAGVPLFMFYGVHLERWAGPQGAPPRRLLLAMLTVCLLATVLGLAAQAAALSGDAADLVHWDSIAAVIGETRFGSWAAVRIVVLVAVLIVTVRMRSGARLWALSAFVTWALLASLTLTGHGVFNDGTAGLVHQGADALHLFAAAIWLGALPALALLVAHARHSAEMVDARIAADNLARFSLIGTLAVTTLVVTGLINSFYLIGLPQLRGALGTAYGRWLAIKLGFFAVMLVLAAANRFRLTPALTATLTSPTDREPALRALRRSLAWEMLFAALVVAAVAVLGTLPPPAST